MKRPVVIVEDDEFIRENLRDFLVGEGFQTFMGVNGQEGLEIIRKLRGDCVVLLDLQMPVMTGEQLLEALKSEPADVQSARIIVITARNEPLEAKISAFLRKPLDLDALLSLVQKLAAKAHER